MPENLDLKKKVWSQIDKAVTNTNTIMASSSSCIIPSKISGDLEHKDQFIVAHPVGLTIWEKSRTSRITVKSKNYLGKVGIHNLRWQDEGGGSGFTQCQRNVNGGG